jgi:hypothetical protein
MADIDKAFFYKTFLEGTFFSELARECVFFPLSVWDADRDQAFSFPEMTREWFGGFFFSFPFGTQISPRGLSFAFFSLPSPQNQKKKMSDPTAWAYADFRPPAPSAAPPARFSSRNEIELKSAFLPAPPSRVPVPEHSPVRKPGDWMCCGEIQFARRTICRNCGKNRPGEEAVVLKPGDWKCCNEVQFASRKVCRKCGKERPDLKEPEAGKRKRAPEFPPLRPGDWICPEEGCKRLQFERNAVCRDCGKSKPAKNSDVAEACVVCYEKIRNASFLHEGTQHLAACMECAEKWVAKEKICPVCREPVECIVKTFA